MQRERNIPTPARYAGAVLLVGIATVLTRLLSDIGEVGISPLLFAAVLISAWFGGLGPGLLATALSGFATAYLLLPQLGTFRGVQDAVIRVLVFIIVALLASSLHAATRRAQEAMRRARDAAEDASAAKTRFLATVSHELRSPLSSIVMIAQSLRQRGALSPTVEKDVETILRCAQLEARLIDDLVDLSRFGSGKLSLECRPLDIHEPLREAVRFSEPDACERQLELLVELRAELSLVFGDPDRLQQIFWNLIRNAIKFTPEQGQITIRTFNTPDQGQVVVEISDTGIGIDSSRLSSIFQAFEQGSPDITARFGGLGLGLAIARTLAEAHNASLHARSAGPSQGATFTFSIRPARATETTESGTRLDSLANAKPL